MRVWQRENYQVKEVEHDYDLKAFAVVYKGEVIFTITPATIDDMDNIIEALDAGEDVNGWEDGAGNTIFVPDEPTKAKERLTIWLNPEVATALRVAAAKAGGRGKMSELAEVMIREGLRKGVVDNESN